MKLSIKSKLLGLFTGLLLISGSGYSQTVNILVDSWMTGSWRYPDSVAIRNAYNVHFTTVNITYASVPSTGNLAGYDVVIGTGMNLSGVNTTLTAANRAVLQAFVANGGHVVWTTEAGCCGGGNEILNLINNIWGYNLNRTFGNGNGCPPYHGGNGPGGLSQGIAGLNTTSSYEYFWGNNLASENVVFARPGGTSTCNLQTIQGLEYLFPGPLQCNIAGGTVILSGEVQFWANVLTSGQWPAHQANIARFHEAMITGNTVQVNAWNTGLIPNSACPAPTPCVVLTVEFDHFDVTREGQNAALLDWSTLIELQNAGFEIEHALPTDGDLEFHKVGFVDGYGTTDIPQDYNFRVHDLIPGTHHFRLKQVNRNGVGAYSEIRSLEIPLSSEAVNIYPTVWDDATTAVNVDFGRVVPVQISLVDLRGRMVKQLFAGESTQGTLRVPLTGQLASGTYLLQVRSEAVNLTRRIVIK